MRCLHAVRGLASSTGPGAATLRPRLLCMQRAAAARPAARWAGAAAAAAAAGCLGVAATDQQQGVRCAPAGTLLFSFGFNVAGQLGQGDTKSLGIPTPIEDLEDEGIAMVAAAGEASVFLTTDGRIFTCGVGSDGQLGHGKPFGECNPCEIQRTDDGAAIASLGIKLVATADRHMAAVSADGHLYTWGEGVGCGFAGNQMLTRPKLVLGLENVNTVSCGNYHTAVTNNKGDLYTFGEGRARQLGHGGRKDFALPTKVEGLATQTVVDAKCGRDFTICLTDKGEVFSFGSDETGQLGGVTGEKFQAVPKSISSLKKKGIIAIAVGEKHAAALGSDGSVYCWGHGKDGQIGNDANLDCSRPELVSALKHDNVVVTAIACGSGHTGAVTAKGELYLWGRGRSGQLGLGDQNRSQAFYRRTPVHVDAISGYTVTKLALGGDHTIVTAAPAR